jgi:hypothetical protein
MLKTSSHRRLPAALTGFATALLLIVVSSPVAGSAAAKLFTGGESGPTPEVAVRAAMRNAQTSSSSAFIPEVFDGAGYGSTAETAVRQAIGDGETTASAYGLYTCELVEEPEVFPQPPGSLRAFRAHVRLRCTP